MPEPESTSTGPASAVGSPDDSGGSLDVRIVVVAVSLFVTGLLAYGVNRFSKDSSQPHQSGQAVAEQPDKSTEARGPSRTGEAGYNYRERKPAASKGTPSESKGRPSESKGRPSESKGRPSESKGRPLESKGRPSESKGRPSEPKRTPSEPRRTPAKAQPGTKSARPKPLAVRPPLPERLTFTDTERQRAVGKQLMLKLTNGTTMTGKVLSVGEDRLTITRSGAQVSVRWDRISFDSLYELKIQVIPRSSAEEFFQLALHALAAKSGLLARGALLRAVSIDRAIEKRFAPYRTMLFHQLREASGPALRAGMKYLREKNLLYALGKFKQARKIHDGPEVNNAIGEVYYHQRRFDQALEHFDKALALKPDYLAGLLNRGYVNFFSQRYEAAKRDFTHALQVDPTNRAAKSYASIVQKVLDGPGWTKGYDVKTSHYFLSTDHSMDYAKRMVKELEGIYKAYDKQFRAAKRKNTRLRFRVIMFKNRTLYSKYTAGVTGSHFAATRTAGFYSPILKQLVLWDNRNVVETLYHEGFHQFLDFFLENPPRWFNEGLAEVFETAKKQPDGTFKFFEINQQDLRLVKTYIQRNQAYTIEKLLNLPVADFYKNARKTYPLSWSLCYFLIHGERGAFRSLMTRFFQSLLKGESPKEAYKKAFGKMDMAELDQRWKKYMLGLK